MIGKHPDQYAPMEVPPLFRLPTAPYQRHSDTSKAAAREIATDAGTLRERVYAYLLSCPDGATDQEIQNALGMDPNTQRPRRVELVRAGRVRKTERTRKTTSGRAAAVWEVV